MYTDCPNLLSLSSSCSSPFYFSSYHYSASVPCLLMTCPKKSSCLCLIVFINVRWTPAALSTSRLLFFSVHELFSILLKNDISTALSLSFIVSEIVQVPLYARPICCLSPQSRRYLTFGFAREIHQLNLQNSCASSCGLVEKWGVDASFEGQTTTGSQIIFTPTDGSPCRQFF